MPTSISTQGSQSSAQRTQRNSLALLCRYLCDLGVLVRSSQGARCCCVAALFGCVIAVWWGGAPNKLRLLVPAAGTQANENEIDDGLQTAATKALGQREGTIIVMDPQSGRVRALVNSQIAFENSFAPGSTIKPFTALAALRAGLIDRNSRALCREHYSREDFDTVCSHPRNLPPLNPSAAIAYSCNYYFGMLGERLSEESLSDTLSSFGFGKLTSDHALLESQGELLRGKHNPRNALGEGDHLQATPIQLITAYAALVNGGHLLSPRVASLADFQVSPRAQLEIAAEHRSIIIEGMRNAVRYGTAARAGLNSSSLYIFGKTGTSAPAQGFRTQGWFVGFASEPNNETLPSPGETNLAVLVFLKRAHGADAAALSREIFQEYELSRHGETRKGKDGAEGTGNAETRRQGDPGTLSISRRKSTTTPAHLPASSSPGPSSSAAGIRVHLVRENVTREITQEDYVLGVVAAEGSSEDQPEALKALAIAARTYAVKNAGRHAREGFDFCTTTHCQRFLFAADHAPIRPAILNAVKQTATEILRDEKGQLVDSYFSAACGGVTANMQTLWGVRAPAYLRGVRDEYCSTMPHHTWTDVISAEQLLRALRSDARTDPGASLHEVTVTRRDETGRAELIVIDGERRRTVNGWDFKIIVGRKLGWNLLKSSRFEIARSGLDYIFRGSGFGHGLGLCQEGAHVMAQRGASYRQILGKYFPGTGVGSVLELRGIAAARPYDGACRFDDQPWIFADVLWGTETLSASESALTPPRRGRAGKRATLSSEHFRVSYPADVPQSDAERILKTLEASRSDLLHRISSAGLSLEQFSSPEIFINATTGDFVGRTGQPWWAAAATKGNRIELQPTGVLKRRGVLETTLRHELVHALIDSISHGRASRWLAEGMALYFAGEGPMILRYAPQAKLTAAEIEQKLAHPATADEMRTAYAAAYREVSTLIKIEGEVSVWRRVASS